MRKLLALALAAVAFAAPARASFGPSAVLFHQNTVMRNTAALSSITDISVIADLDATVSGSYAGSGTSWTSLVSSPADGTTQAANAYTAGGTFTGSAGSASAYFAQSGSSSAQLTGAATSFMTGLQNDSSSWWVVMVLNLGSTASQFVWASSTSSSTAGVSLIINSAGSPKFNFAQYTTSSKQIVSWSPSTYPSSGSDFVVLLSHNAGANTRVWYNSASNGIESSTLFTAASVTGNKLGFGSRGSSSYMASGGRIKEIGYGPGYLSTAQAGEIIHLLESRHQNDYDGNGIVGN